MTIEEFLEEESKFLDGLIELAKMVEKTVKEVEQLKERVEKIEQELAPEQRINPESTFHKHNIPGGSDLSCTSSNRSGKDVSSS